MEPSLERHLGDPFVPTEQASDDRRATASGSADEDRRAEAPRQLWKEWLSATIGRHLRGTQVIVTPIERSGGPPDSTQVMTRYGQAMTRAGSIFTVGMMAIVPFGIASLAITTRFLEPAEFGRLAILYSVASVLTVLSGLGVFQGTLISVYGIGDDDEGGGDGVDVVASEAPAATSEERRRLLGSGLLILIAMATALCAVVGLIGIGLTLVALDSSWVAGITWMAASAWAGAIWRLVHQVPRMERRPARWATLQFLRPGLVLAATVVALAAGLGVDGVLLATAAGTIVATAMAFLISRRCFRFEAHLDDIGVLWKNGRHWVPLTLAAVVQGNVNVLLLGVLASPASVGLFQVANRIAQIPSYFADGFLTGWPAMERSPISLAAKERKGRPEYSAGVFTLFALTTLGLLFAVSLFSGVLIHIAAPSYDSAAPLIPVVAASYGAFAVFRGAFRATSFPARRYWFMLLHLIWILPYAVVAGLLTPLDPSYGVAVAQLSAGVIVSAAFVAIDRRGPRPTPFEWRRLGVALLMATACILIAHQIPGPSLVRAVISLAALAVFPLLLVITGVLPRDQIKTVKAIVASVLPRRLKKKDARRRLAQLPDRDRDAIALTICRGLAPGDAAATLGSSVDVTLARMVRGLRGLADGGRATPMDHLIGEYVLHPGTTIERDAWASHLCAQGVDPLELHVLDEAKRALAPRRRVKP